MKPSCYDKYKSYFSPDLRDAFIENGLSLPYILEFADEHCNDRSCEHHIFYTPDELGDNYKGERYGAHGTLAVNRDQQKIVPWVQQCRGCMCLLSLVSERTTYDDIAGAFGIHVRGVEAHAKKGLDRAKKILADKEES